MRAPNPHLGLGFPRRKDQITMGEALEPRALHGERVRKRETIEERGSHRSVLETGETIK
jgi:hypothetical protein